MRIFNYSIIKEHKWDSELLGLVASIYKEAGKQDFYLKMRPEEIHLLNNLSQKKRLPEPVMNKKLRDTEMLLILSMRTLMKFRFPKTISYNFIK